MRYSWLLLVISLLILLISSSLLADRGMLTEVLIWVGVIGVMLSSIRLFYTIGLGFVNRAPIVEERHLAVITRHGRFLDIRGPGRIWPWLLKPLRFTFDDIKTIIPEKTLPGETPSENILVKDGIEVAAQLQFWYRLISDPGPTTAAQERPVYKAAFEVPDWRDAIENKVAPLVLRTVVGAQSVKNLIQHQDDVNKILHKEIADRINGWGFEVERAELRNLHVPPGVNEALLRGMQLGTISESLSEIAKERMTVVTAALEQGIDPRDVITPHDVLILQYIDALQKMAGTQSTKLVVLPYDILEATAGLRGVLWGRQPAGQAPPGAVLPGAPATQAAPGQAGPAPQSSAPQQTAAPVQPAGSPEAPSTSPGTANKV